MALDYTQNLKAFLESNSAVAGLVASRIHHNNVPTERGDYIWLRRAGNQYERTFDEAAGTAPRSVLYDVECCSQYIDNSAAIADAVKNLFPFSGTFGDSTVKGAFVNDQDEDYVPLNSSASVGINVQALQVEICP